MMHKTWNISIRQNGAAVKCEKTRQIKTVNKDVVSVRIKTLVVLKNVEFTLIKEKPG